MKLEEAKEETKPKKSKKPPRTIEVEEYYVKYKNFSYLHCEWRTEEELLRGDKRIPAKLKRFHQKRAQAANMFEFLEEDLFNPDYIEVDRVLDKAEHTDAATGKVTRKTRHGNSKKMSTRLKSNIMRKSTSFQAKKRIHLKAKRSQDPANGKSWTNRLST